MQKQRKKILAALEELFFTVKITDAAKRAGMSVEFVKTPDELIERAKAEKPSLIIIDLNFNAIEPLKLIPRVKRDPELRGVSVIGYLSHIQGELKQKAHETGVDMVLARAALSQNLQQILKRHAGMP
ncbi:MAG: response regulator [bacterium]|jgi:PleD family two-component response regulator